MLPMGAAMPEGRISLTASVNEELYSSEFEAPWKEHVARENFKSLVLREKLVSRSSRPVTPRELSSTPLEVKAAQRADDIRSSSLNVSGWPQSQLHSSAAVQNKIYEETLATTPGTQELLSSVKSAGEFYMP
mmetsp:Transcript_32341/g.80151  ORF Transcript_32341/g.80151 Transcript_32341/m.80151 type:complete len:132 (-) Transcript_32341:901-1296(-)